MQLYTQGILRYNIKISIELDPEVGEFLRTCKTFNRPLGLLPTSNKILAMWFHEGGCDGAKYENLPVDLILGIDFYPQLYREIGKEWKYWCVPLTCATIEKIRSDLHLNSVSLAFCFGKELL